MKTYLYPQNLKARANLWLWSLRDFVILCADVLVRQEIGTEKTFHRSLDAAVEETGQTARIAFAHQHFHYFVTVAAQQLFHCNGLGQMPAAFSLNDKKDFHWDDLMIYKLLLKHM